MQRQKACLQARASSYCTGPRHVLRCGVPGSDGQGFLTATAVPLLGLAGAIAYRLRPAEWQKREGKQARMPATASSRAC
jgi:hypothetical protein